MNTKKLIMIFSIVILMGMLISPISGENSSAPKQALKLEKKGDAETKSKAYDKALEYYKQALEIYPDMDSVHYKIASIHAFRKNFKEALESLRESLRINKDGLNAKRAFIDTALKYGNSLLQNRNIEEANELFIEMTALEGLKDIDAKLLTEMDYRIGFNFFQLRNADKSNEYLLRFINTPGSPTDFPKFYSTANYLLGLNYSQVEDNENSNKYLTAFVDLNKDDPENKYIGFARYVLGMNNFNVLKMNIDKIEKAKTRTNLEESSKKIIELATAETGIEENLLFAIEKTPDLENAYVILGNYYYLKKDIPNSIKYYRTLIEKFPGSADIEVYKVFLKDIEKQQN